MKRYATLYLTILSIPVAIAQGTQPLVMDDMVVVATGYETERLETAHTVYFLGDDELRLRLQASTFPDALQDVPGVMLQKTGHGMTSPYLRGLTSQRIVLVGDGIRLNNSFLREGPNQYWNQTDPFFFHTVDVMMGPASVLYGSDAMGGVVYARSTPLTRGMAGQGLQWIDGEMLFRAATAEASLSEHIEGEIAMDDRWSLRLGLTRQDFGDLATGNDVNNPNTGYEQWGANVRLGVWLEHDQRLLFGYDHFDQDDVDRVHRTVTHQDFHGTLSKGSTGDLRRIYDHDRRTAFARYELRNGAGLVEEVDAQLSYSRLGEDYVRHRSVTRADYRPTDIDTLAFALRLQTPSDLGTWNYGIDVYHDWVDSDGWNIDTGARTDLDQGVVADDAKYLLAGGYIQNEKDLSDDLTMSTGLRYTHASLRAGTVAFTNPDYVDSLYGDWDAVTGSLRLLYRAAAENSLNLFAGVSQGFRAPNLSDATRDDEFGGGDESPTADLDPEHFTTLEAGLKHRGERTSLEVVAYHTFMRDRIGRVLLNGNDTKVNLDNGYIQGIEAVGRWRIAEPLSVFGRAAWQQGSEDTYIDREILNGTADRPVSRMHPLTAEIGVRWKSPNAPFWLECSIEMAEQQDRLADAETTDNRFPPEGTPGYAVVGLRGGIALGEETDLAIALENIGDTEYRIHGSGVNEPGRNLVVSARHRF